MFRTIAKCFLGDVFWVTYTKKLEKKIAAILGRQAPLITAIMKESVDIKDIMEDDIFIEEAVELISTKVGNYKRKISKRFGKKGSEGIENKDRFGEKEEYPLWVKESIIEPCRRLSKNKDKRRRISAVRDEKN